MQLATGLIERRGYSGFSYKDLADELGIAKASIHHHFPSKEDLGMALLEGTKQFLSDKLEAVQKCPGSTAWQRIEHFFQEGCERACGENRVCLLGALISDYENLPEAVQEKLSAVCEHERKIIAELLSGGRESGEIAFVGSAEQQADFVVDTIKGAMMYSRVRPGGALSETLTVLRRALSGV